jgi:hypothetical protein
LLPALLGISTIESQTITRSNVPAPAFEVTGSIYPWEVHDEGIDLILDNMTSIAGINSVYMLAVMHQERRPFNSPGSKNVWQDQTGAFQPFMVKSNRLAKNCIG